MEKEVQKSPNTGLVYNLLFAIAIYLCLRGDPFKKNFSGVIYDFIYFDLGDSQYPKISKCLIIWDLKEFCVRFQLPTTYLIVLWGQLSFGMNFL